MRIVIGITHTVILASFLISCSDSSEAEKEIIKEMGQSLEMSNHAINNSAQDILNQIEKKKFEPSTRERASFWFPKAERIAMLSNIYFNYIDALKKEGRLSREKFDQLYKTLNEIPSDFFASDSLLHYAFSNNTKNILDSNAISGDYLYSLFNNSTKEAYTSILTQFQNRIKILEWEVISFCKEQIGSLDGFGFYSSYSFIVGQNYEVLKKGSNLEITAGIGAFSKNAKPQIVINGIPLAINEDGFSIYKNKINKPPGKYFIPVQISYIDMDGKQQIVEKKIEYTVAKECDQ